MYLKKFIKEFKRQVVPNRITYISSICFLLLFLSTMNVWAGTIFEFHPFFTPEAVYNDNIFTTRSDTRSDWITTLSPGFITSLLHPRFNYTLEYRPGIVYYLHHPENDYTSQEVNFKGIIELTPRLTLSLYERYIRSINSLVTELEETDYERSLRRRTLIMFNRNIISSQLKYRFGRDNLISLYYRNTNYRSGDPLENDYVESYCKSEMEYWFNVRNALNLKTHFTKGNFDFTNTDLLYSVDITVRYIRRFTPHFDLYGEYGAGVADFEERRYFMSLDRRREVQVDSQDVEDYDLRKFNLGFEWQLPQNFHIEGSIGYFWRSGKGSRDDQGITSLFEIDKSLEDLTLSLTWESGYSASYFAVRDSGFTEFWRIKTDLAYNYHDILEFRCHGSYGYREYTFGRGTGSAITKREDYQYMYNISLNYHILRNYGLLRDLSFKMQFSHVELDSSVDYNYYITNQFTANITATF